VPDSNRLPVPPSEETAFDAVPAAWSPGTWFRRLVGARERVLPQPPRAEHGSPAAEPSTAAATTASVHAAQADDPEPAAVAVTQAAQESVPLAAPAPAPAPASASASASPDPQQRRDDAAPQQAGTTPELRAEHAHIQAAVDEIARRVISSSGLLDCCAKAAHAALADLEALQDEAQHAQKMLATVRARLLALDQRSSALTLAALDAQPGAQPRAALEKLAQAVQMQTLHCHQLAERLTLQDRSHGPRMRSMRQGIDAIELHAERGLRESQQLMMLTRKIHDALVRAARSAPGASAAAEAEVARR